ncbi:uncharacterized protein METZ01_LOCUS22978 [marine metagenome]|uniref:Uncharacterized protein n=1 Tax=marine metagenome TaxID=408172 RepID=A0A381PTZ2_9ZZZZ
MTRQPRITHAFPYKRAARKIAALFSPESSDVGKRRTDKVSKP